MRALIAAVLGMHGIAHVVGFVVPWRLIVSAEIPYRTTVFGGALDIGAVGVRLVGLAWLTVALLFVAFAGNILWQSQWREEHAYGLVAASVVLCLLGWPEARPGLFANAAIVLLVVMARVLEIGREIHE